MEIRRAFVIVAVLVAGACSQMGGDSEGGAGGGASGSAWQSGDCAALGADTLPSGACYLPCKAPSDCPAGTTCVNQKYQPYCRPNPCNTDSDCGPTGWACQGNDLCFIRCTTVSSTSSECPDGYECQKPIPSYAPVCQKLPGGVCTEPCPSGCCHSSGAFCCKPPFCTGDCSGSACC